MKVCFIWSGNLENNAERGSALYGAETWRTTQSVELLSIERKPGGQHRVLCCFIWSGNLEDNAECVCFISSGNLEDNAECWSALYGAEIWRTTQSVGLLYIDRKFGGQCRVWVCFIWSGNLEVNAECGSALYGAEI